MPRPPRADEAGGLYHAPNRGNAPAAIFRKDADYAAFQRIVAEGLGRYDVRQFAFQWMPNHWHFVLRPNRDGEMSRFLRWVERGNDPLTDRELAAIRDSVQRGSPQANRHGGA